MANDVNDSVFSAIFGGLAGGIESAIRSVVRDMMEKGEIETVSGGCLGRDKAAQYLDVSSVTIDRLREAGEIKAVQVGEIRKYEIVELNRYLRKHRVK